MFLSSFCVGDDIPGHRILVVLKAEEKKKNSKLAKPIATILCLYFQNLRYESIHSTVFTQQLLSAKKHIKYWG